MANEFFGKTVGLYYSQDSTVDFNNKTLITDSFPLTYPIKADGSFPSNSNLYNNGVFVPATATALDACIPSWEIIRGLYIEHPSYSGSVPKDELRALTPDLTDVSGYMGSGYTNFFFYSEGNAQFLLFRLENEGDHYRLIVPQLYTVSTGLPVSNTGKNLVPYCIIGIDIQKGAKVNYPFKNGTSIASYSDMANTPTNGRIHFGSADLLSNFANYEFFQGFEDNYLPPVPPPEDTDPFAPGGTSEPGGGNGTFNGTSDSNPIPGDPTISATDTGFMTVFATNVAGIQSLANSLWTDLFSAISPGGTLEGTVEALKSLVNSPYDAILGCHIVPVNVPTGSSKNVKLYGVLPSTVSLPVASSQWVHKDCGSLTIQPYDGSYLDYAPYSKVTSLYLPFVGVVSVDIDIIMNTTIGVYYKIDIISGQCIVYVTKNNDVYFQYQGQCAVPIPVTSIDWSNTVSSGLGLIGSVTNIVGSAVGGALAGGPAGALSGAVTGTIGQAGSMAQNVMNSKPDIKAGSGVGGAAALLGCKSPYLIIERPRKSTPKNQNHYTGYPSNIRAKLGDLEGYTEVSRVYVNHMSATTEEKEEIERLLNNGVVFPARS